jgi:hypothetical protein
MQENLARVGAVLARAALVVVSLIVAVGPLRGQPFVEMLVFGIALAGSRVAVGQRVDDVASFQVHDDGAVPLSLAPRPVVDAHDARGL